MCQQNEWPQFIKELEWDVGPNICVADDWCEEQTHCGSPRGYFAECEALDSPPCPAYVPTRYELMVLAVHWFMEVRYMELLDFCEAPLVFPEDYAVLTPAYERLDSLGEVLDEKTRQRVLAAVERECRERLGDRWLTYKAHEAHKAAMKAQQDGDSKGPAAETETAMPSAEAEPCDYYGTLVRMREAAKR
jgi:hypothetical protein